MRRSNPTWFSRSVAPRMGSVNLNEPLDGIRSCITSRSPYGERESKLTGQEEGVIGAYVAPRMGSVNLNNRRKRHRGTE